jgi:hypothetical protein
MIWRKFVSCGRCGVLPSASSPAGRLSPWFFNAGLFDDANLRLAQFGAAPAGQWH